MVRSTEYAVSLVERDPGRNGRNQARRLAKKHIHAAVWLFIDASMP